LISLDQQSTRLPISRSDRPDQRGVVNHHGPSVCNIFESVAS
jgi:hypothetical protein